MKKIVELDSIQKKFKEKVIFDSFSCILRFWFRNSEI